MTSTFDSADELGLRRGSRPRDLDVAVARESVRARMFGDAEPIRVGRLELRQRIGSGGMGIVYAAHDPQLDRPVAVKLLRADRLRDRERASEILRAEARALAQLDHPNVVKVYDVGEVGSLLYIAMELVPGTHLRRWLAVRHPLAEIVAQFHAIALGVAAAHDAGIVHRDLKPENVLVGADGGRPRIVDFGLARVVDTSVPADGSFRPGSSRSSASTRPAGTPGYVAPEVLTGARADVRGDVYSFAATLYEALYGHLPRSDTDAIPARTPAGERVPRALRRVLVRSLVADRERRVASMQPLVDALAAGARRRLPGVMAVGIVALVGTVVLALGRPLADARQRAACEAEGARIGEIWNDGAREALRAGMLASQSRSAAATLERAIPRIDTWVGAWSSARASACVDAHVEHTSSVDTHARASVCFDEQASRLAALLEVFGSADRSAAPRLLGAIHGLPAPESCADVDALARMRLPADAHAIEIAGELHASLGRAAALEAGARYDEGLQLAREVAARAHADGLAALAAEAELWVGALLVRTGEFAAAERVLEDSFHLATREQADRIALRAASTLVHLVGSRQQRHVDGLAWGRHAQSAYERLGRPYPELAGTLHNNLGLVLDDQGQSAAAVQEYEQALALFESALGPEHPEVARTLDNLASARFSVNDLDLAERDAARALAIREAALGPEHPDTGSVHSTLAMIAARRGDVDVAIERYRRVLAILDASVGPDHPEIARILHNIGECESQRGNFRVALDWLGRARAMLERTLGPEHPNLVMSLGALADAHLGLGEVVKAHDELARALGICEATLGAEHMLCATVTSALGRVAFERGDLDEAVRRHARSLAVQEAILGSRHPDLAVPLLGIAEAELARGDAPAAVAAAERASALRESSDVAPELRTAAREVLTRARQLAAAPPKAGHRGD